MHPQWYLFRRPIKCDELNALEVAIFVEAVVNSPDAQVLPPTVASDE